MAYRRKIIDRRTREGRALGKKIDALKGFGILALLIGYLVFGRGHSDKPSGDGKDSFVTPAQATPLEPVPTRQQQPTGFTFAASSLPLQTPAAGTDTGSGRQLVPWRHVTDSGVRWSLRRVNTTSMLLVIDLGGEQIANVRVAPAFENLDLTGMNNRVDFVRSVIGREFPLQTANFSFDRDGVVRQLP